MIEALKVFVMSVAAISAFLGGVSIAASRRLSAGLCWLSGFLGVVALAVLWASGDMVFGR
jgi:hypothetical protein